MSKPIILCIDDQREILSAIQRELGSFEQEYEIVTSESAPETEELLGEFKGAQRALALVICDHIMPGENGIDFLARLKESLLLKDTPKILLTGLASQQDTIKAINEAGINYYLEKPWSSEKLLAVVNKLLK